MTDPTCENCTYEYNKEDGNEYLCQNCLNAYYKGWDDAINEISDN